MLARLVSVTSVAFAIAQDLFIQQQQSAQWPSDDDLIGRTKDYFATATGWFGPFKNESFADDFVMRGPIVGPFDYEDLYKTLHAAAPWMAFSDFKANPRACWVDHADDEFGRHVYCALYPSGKHTKPYHLGPATFKPTNKTIQSSGEVWSVLWNLDMKVRHITVGYPINAHRGTGCGFGAAWGLLCLIGKPMWELRDSFDALWRFGAAHTAWDKLPKWYNDFCQGPLCHSSRESQRASALI